MARSFVPAWIKRAFAGSFGGEQTRHSARPTRLPVKASFAGGETTRLTAFPQATTMSPDQEIHGNLRTLRARARWLARNNAYGAGFCRELVNNVVGPGGIMLQAKVGSRTGTLNKRTNDAIERAFAEWAEPEHCTVDGRDGWVDVQALAVQTLAVDGEVFLWKRRAFANAFGFALQFLDADLVDETLNQRPHTEGANRIVMGVELDAWGRAVAYHAWKSYTGEGAKRERVRIPADEILHLFVRYRPNQTRGVSWFAPVVENASHLDRYLYAELIASETAAANMAVIENKSEAAIAAFDFDQQKDADGKFVPQQYEVEPGKIAELLPGQELKGFETGHPNAGTADFTKVILRGFAKGVGMAYSTLTGDLSDANYGSQRGGLLGERDGYRMIQRVLIAKLCRPVYREWLPEALLSGKVEVDSRLASKYQEVAWKPRGYQWIDPESDLNALEKEIHLGLTSRQRACAERGVDYEEVVDELAHEQAYAGEMGVDVSGSDKAAPPAPGQPGSPDEGEDDEQDDEQGDDKGDEQRPPLRKVK